MARRYASEEKTVKARLADRRKKEANPDEWSSAPRFYAENGEIYLCRNCTVSLLMELGVPLEKIAACKRFDWRRASVETVEAFESMGGWVELSPKPDAKPEPSKVASKPATRTYGEIKPASESASEPAGSDDTKALLKALSGMQQQMELQGKAIAQLHKMITE